MGLLPVLIVQQGQDSPLGQGKESRPVGWGPLPDPLSRPEAHHRLPLKEMHSSDFLSHILVSWCFATVFRACCLWYHKGTNPLPESGGENG